MFIYEELNHNSRITQGTFVTYHED